MIDYNTTTYTRRHRLVWRRLCRALRGLLVRDRFDRSMPSDWKWPV